MPEFFSKTILEFNIIIIGLNNGVGTGRAGKLTYTHTHSCAGHTHTCLYNYNCIGKLGGGVRCRIYGRGWRRTLCLPTPKQLTAVSPSIAYT